MSSKIKWACPKCGAEPDKCGKGKCPRFNGQCSGFICECDEYSEVHGETLKDPCPTATCYHCGWGGKFPTPRHFKKANLVPCPHCKGTGTVKGGSTT